MHHLPGVVLPGSLTALVLATSSLANVAVADDALFRETVAPISSAYPLAAISAPCAEDTAGADDIDLLLDHVHSQTNDPKFDGSGDGLVDEADVDELVRNILTTRHGDTNFDGAVDMTDFKTLATNFGIAATSWGDRDGTVTFADFLRLQNNHGFGKGGVGP